MICIFANSRHTSTASATVRRPHEYYILCAHKTACLHSMLLLPLLLGHCYHILLAEYIHSPFILHVHMYTTSIFVRDASVRYSGVKQTAPAHARARALAHVWRQCGTGKIAPKLRSSSASRSFADGDAHVAGALCVCVFRVPCVPRFLYTYNILGKWHMKFLTVCVCVWVALPLFGERLCTYSVCMAYYMRPA